jgi:GR25 family glycosyltransferase involved in LPS biosynthesis
MVWCGYYINLDRSPERRRAMERQITALELQGSYSRFPAVDGRLLETVPGDRTRGEFGIFKSHLELIRLAARSKLHIHVMEDDVRLSTITAPYVARIAAGIFTRYDIVVMDTGIGDHFGQYHALRKIMSSLKASGEPFNKVRLLDISKAYAWGMTSYILTPEGAGKFQAEAEEELARGPKLPIDMVLARAVREGRISIGATFPFLTWLNLDHATQSLADRDRGWRFKETVHQLARYPFFVDADLRGFLIPSLRKLIAEAEKLGEDSMSPRSRRALGNARFLLDDAVKLIAENDGS